MKSEALTAHEVTTVHSHRAHVAGAVGRSAEAVASVPLTEIGRVLIEDQVRLGRGLVVRIVGLELNFVLELPPVPNFPEIPNVTEAAGIPAEDARRPVELLLEGTAHFSEVRESHPARLHGTGTRHSVALTVAMHERLDVLQQDKEQFTPSPRLPGIPFGINQGQNPPQLPCIFPSCEFFCEFWYFENSEQILKKDS